MTLELVEIDNNVLSCDNSLLSPIEPGKLIVFPELAWELHVFPWEPLDNETLIHITSRPHI